MKLPVDYPSTPMSERRLVREEYIRIQGGHCHHCKGLLEQSPREDRKVKPHLYPKGFFTHPVHLHHSHVTGLTIGAVHNHCNAVLWEYYGE